MSDNLEASKGASTSRRWRPTRDDETSANPFKKKSPHDESYTRDFSQNSWTREALENSEVASTATISVTRTSHMLAKTLPWYQSGTGHELDTYNFWTSAPVLACFFFVALSFIWRELWFLYGAVGVVLFEAFVVTAGWIEYVSASPEVKDWIDTNKKYLNMAHRDVMAFTDTKEKHRARRIYTAGILHFGNAHRDTLTNYIQKRKQVLMNEAAKRHTT